MVSLTMVSSSGAGRRATEVDALVGSDALLCCAPRDAAQGLSQHPTGVPRSSKTAHPKPCTLDPEP